MNSKENSPWNEKGKDGEFKEECYEGRGLDMQEERIGCAEV